MVTVVEENIYREEMHTLSVNPKHPPSASQHGSGWMRPPWVTTLNTLHYKVMFVASHFRSTRPIGTDDARTEVATQYTTCAVGAAVKPKLSHLWQEKSSFNTTYQTQPTLYSRITTSSIVKLFRGFAEREFVTKWLPQMFNLPDTPTEESPVCNSLKVELTFILIHSKVNHFYP